MWTSFTILTSIKIDINEFYPQRWLFWIYVEIFEAYEKGYVHYAQDKDMEVNSTCIISWCSESIQFELVQSVSRPRTKLL